jgi:hypothetical protein
LIALQIVYHLESYNKYSGFVLKFNELDGKKNIVANYNLQIKIVNPNVNRLGALEYLSQITYSIFYSLADVGDSAHGCIGTA